MLFCSSVLFLGGFRGRREWFEWVRALTSPSALQPETFQVILFVWLTHNICEHFPILHVSLKINALSQRTHSGMRKQDANFRQGVWLIFVLAQCFQYCQFRHKETVSPAPFGNQSINQSLATHGLHSHNVITSWKKLTTVPKEMECLSLPSPHKYYQHLHVSITSLTCMCQLLSSYIQLQLVIPRLVSSQWLVNQRVKYIASKICEWKHD